jgi:hypothetical protein
VVVNTNGTILTTGDRSQGVLAESIGGGGGDGASNSGFFAAGASGAAGGNGGSVTVANSSPPEEDELQRCLRGERRAHAFRNPLH